MADCFFEDLTVGDVRSYGRIVVDREAMIAFARQYDPQSFHLDEDAAKTSFLGALIASGWFVACCHMKIMTADTLPNAGIMGGAGIDELKWLKPVLAGDVLSGRRTILAKRTSASKPDRGLVQTRFEMVNQRGETVMSQLTWEVFAMRAAHAMPVAATKPAAARPVVAAGNGRPEGPLVDRLGFFEDIAVGSVQFLGEKTFLADEIMDFARQWDPQTFHLDREAARQSHFGTLVASGWQTACEFMGCLVRARTAMQAAGAVDGRIARLGPSPGVEHLRWFQPTREGDTIRYYSQVKDKRESASRPGWGIVTSQGSGYNGRGERVFELTAAVFWERRQP